MRLRELTDPDHLPALDPRYALDRPALGLGLSQTQVQAADGAARPCFHALFATGSPKQQASR